MEHPPSPDTITQTAVALAEYEDAVAPEILVRLIAIDMNNPHLWAKHKQTLSPGRSCGS